jgi:hypothetical protein
MSYTFYKILSTDNIGYSLTNINANYSNLQNMIVDVTLDYQNKWQPIIDFYNQNIDKLKSNLTLIQNNSAQWFDFRTNVRNLSSDWLQTFTIFYPKILQAPFSQNAGYVAQVLEWLNTNYPVQNITNKTTIYAENQKAIIYIYTYNKETQINNTTELSDQTTCVVTNSRVCIECTTTASGTVRCNQGSYNCNWTGTCQSCVTSDCEYADDDKTSYLNIRDNKHTADSKVIADVSMFFSNRSENTTITAIVCKVVDCNWQFSNYLTGQNVP